MPNSQTLGSINNPFLISLITTLVNVCSTPISFYTIERFGRRPLLIYGASEFPAYLKFIQTNESVGMFVCEFICAIIGVTDGSNQNAVKAQIALICIYIFFFASTWGPGAWVVSLSVTGEFRRNEADYIFRLSVKSSLFLSDLEVLVFPPLPTGTSALLESRVLLT